MRYTSAALFGGLLVLASRLSLADAGLGKPVPVDIYSANGSFVVHIDPTSNRSSAYEKKSGRSLWSIPDWFRIAFLSDDGTVLVAGFDGGSLIPTRHPPSLAMLRFYENGRLVGTVALEKLISERKLVKTSSHLRWGQYLGFNAKGHFLVRTVEGVVISFDRTGHIIEP